MTTLQELNKEYNITERSLDFSWHYRNKAYEYMEMTEDILDSFDKDIKVINALESEDIYFGLEAEQPVRGNIDKGIMEKIKHAIQKILLSIQNVVKSIITYFQGKIARGQNKFYEKHKKSISAGLQKNGKEKKFKGIVVKGGRKNVAKGISLISKLLIKTWNIVLDDFKNLPKTLNRGVEIIDAEKITNDFFIKISTQLNRTIETSKQNYRDNTKLIYDTKTLKANIRKEIYGKEEKREEVSVIDQYPDVETFKEVLSLERLKNIVEIAKELRKIGKSLKNIEKNISGINVVVSQLLGARFRLTNTLVLNLTLTLSGILFKERVSAMNVLRKILKGVKGVSDSDIKNTKQEAKQEAKQEKKDDKDTAELRKKAEAGDKKSIQILSARGVLTPAEIEKFTEISEIAELRKKAEAGDYKSMQVLASKVNLTPKEMEKFAKIFPTKEEKKKQKVLGLKERADNGDQKAISELIQKNQLTPQEIQNYMKKFPDTTPKRKEQTKPKVRKRSKAQLRGAKKKAKEEEIFSGDVPKNLGVRKETTKRQRKRSGMDIPYL